MWRMVGGECTVANLVDVTRRTRGISLFHTHAHRQMEHDMMSVNVFVYKTAGGRHRSALPERMMGGRGDIGCVWLEGGWKGRDFVGRLLTS